MKILFIALTTLSLYAGSAHAVSQRCSDEQNVIVVFNDNGFNPQLEAFSHASIYEIRPLETALLEEPICRYDRVRGPADAPIDSYNCINTQNPRNEARIYALDQFRQRTAVVKYISRAGLRRITVSCRPL